MDGRSRTARLLVVLAAAGLWLGLTFGARDLLTAAVVVPLARLLQVVDALPQNVVWGAAVAVGAAAGFLALWWPAPAPPPAPGAPPPPPTLRDALAATIRAAETSRTARRELAERLTRIAALLRLPADALPSWVPEDAAADDRGLDAPAVPREGYRARLARALDALERCAEGPPR